MNKQRFLAVSLFVTVAFSSSIFADDMVDSMLPDYTKASGVSGNISSVGSDTLANLMTLWAEEYKKLYPNINIQIQAAGSSTAPPALTEGTSNFGPMSRAMKDGELAAFEARYGYKPTPIRVAIDALAVFANKDNPIQGLNMQQVDAIFSATRKCGFPENITTWGQVGVTGELANLPIQLYGRNSVSGTYGFFKEHVLCKGDYKDTVNEQPGSASVVQGVTKSKNGIGYSGIGYKTSGVKAVPIAREGTAFVEASVDNAATGKYPLSRFLYIYVNKGPNKPLAPLEKEFIKMVLSKVGQKVVVKDGFIPLSAKLAGTELAKIDGGGSVAQK